MTSPFSFPREKIRILLCEGIAPAAIAAFSARGYTNVVRRDGAPGRDELLRDVAEAHVVCIRSRTRLDREILEAATKLVAVGCFCIGTDQVDLDAAAQQGVPVFNAPHANTRSVAELVIGLTIVLMRDSVRKDRMVHEGRWPKSAKGSHEVRGKTLGIVGYGHIGSQVSVLAESIGMNVVFHDIVDQLPLGNAVALRTLDDVLAAADVVTLHVPRTPETRNLVGAEQLRRMRKGSFLINTSRGSVVDADALAVALRDGPLAGAAVDVFPEEPLGTDDALKSPLRGLPNVILSPHVAGSTEEAQEKIGAEVATKLVGYSDRGATVGAVNFPQIALAPHARAHRILHVHRNVPGMLGQINRLIADEEINVLAQHLETLRDLGYVVLDIEKAGSSRLFARLRAIPGTIRARILY